MEDRQLAAKAMQGDTEAFTILAQRYRRYIYTIAYKITLHEEDARDVTQNVLLRMARSISRFTGPGNFRAWLSVITVHAAIDHQRSAFHREQPVEASEIEQLLEDRSDARNRNPREVYEAAHRMHSVEKAMQQLSVQQRAIFALRFLEDRSPKEIAEQLDLSPGQVRTQLYRALNHIRRILANQAAEES